MKLKQYLTEGNIQELKETLRKECAPFFKEVWGSMSPFIFRGYQKNINGYKKIPARQDRKPRFISPALHDLLDEMGKKLFGWKIRSEGVFASREIGSAGRYGKGGKAYIIIPVGNFKYIWNSNVQEMYELYDSMPPDITDRQTLIRYLGAYKWSEDYLFRMLKQYRDKDLKKYVSQAYFKSEVIFKCKEYYLINTDGVLADIIVMLQELAAGK